MVLVSPRTIGPVIDFFAPELNRSSMVLFSSWWVTAAAVCSGSPALRCHFWAFQATALVMLLMTLTEAW